MRPARSMGLAGAVFFLKACKNDPCGKGAGSHGNEILPVKGPPGEKVWDALQAGISLPPFWKMSRDGFSEFLADFKNSVDSKPDITGAARLLFV